MSSVFTAFKDLIEYVKKLISKHDASMDAHQNGFNHDIQIITNENPSIILKDSDYVYGTDVKQNIGDFSFRDSTGTTLGAFGCDTSNQLLCFYIWNNAKGGQGIWYNCPYDTTQDDYISTGAYLKEVKAYDPTAEYHVANKKYVDAACQESNTWRKIGGSLDTSWDMSKGTRIDLTNYLPEPTDYWNGYDLWFGMWGSCIGTCNFDVTTELGTFNLASVSGGTAEAPAAIDTNFQLPIGASRGFSFNAMVGGGTAKNIHFQLVCYRRTHIV